MTTPLPTLLEVIKFVKPTALIGLAGIQGGSFTPEVIRAVAEDVDRPIIFALSNPTSKGTPLTIDADS